MLLWEDRPKTSLPRAGPRAQNEVKEPCSHFASLCCVLSVSTGHRSPPGQHLVPLDSGVKEITPVNNYTTEAELAAHVSVSVYLCVIISHILSSSGNSERPSPLNWWGRGGLEARTQMFRGTCQSSPRLHMFS